MEITFHFPPKELNPNRRLHWAAKAKFAKAYRLECFIIAREAKAAVDWDGDIHLFIDFWPPDKRARDDDNTAASFKSGRDGLADALGVDDVRFRTHPYLHRMPYPGGKVVVRIAKIMGENE